MSSRASLRERPALYRTERRRTLAARVHDLDVELEQLDPRDFRTDVAAYERELALAALEPLTFREGWEDLRYAWRGLWRAILEAVRS